MPPHTTAGMTAENSADTVELDFPATHKYTHLVGVCVLAMLERVERLADRAQLAYNLQLAVQEICANIVNHAYGGATNGTRIRAVVTMGGLPLQIAVTLHDTGIPFDRGAVASPDLDTVPVGGLGLFIAESLLDELTYTHSDAGNTWRLVKLLPTA